MRMLPDPNHFKGREKSLKISIKSLNSVGKQKRQRGPNTGVWQLIATQYQEKIRQGLGQTRARHEHISSSALEDTVLFNWTCTSNLRPEYPSHKAFFKNTAQTGFVLPNSKHPRWRHLCLTEPPTLCNREEKQALLQHAQLTYFRYQLQGKMNHASNAPISLWCQSKTRQPVYLLR